MSILIAGCGFIGRPAGVALAGRGHEVFALSRDRRKADDFARDGLRLVRHDLLDPDASDPIPPVRAILYAVGFDRSLGVPMRTIYVDALLRFLDRLPETVERFVYASSTSVYGADCGEWVDEATPARPNSENGAIVLEAEEAVRSWAERRGVRAVVIRFAGLYGPGRVIGAAALRAGKPIESDPDGPLNLIHRDDAAAVAASAIEHPDPAQIYCACDNRPILRREYYETAARHLDAPTPTFAPPGGESTRRKISNRAMVRDLLRELVHPDITTGLPASIAEEGRSRIERDRSQASAGSM